LPILRGPAKICKILHVGKAMMNLLLLTHFKPNDIPVINENSLLSPLSIINNGCGKLESKLITQKKRKKKGQHINKRENCNDSHNMIQ
jgi:hypothetical protein